MRPNLNNVRRKLESASGEFGDAEAKDMAINEIIEAIQELTDFAESLASKATRYDEFKKKIPD